MKALNLRNQIRRLFGSDRDWKWESPDADIPIRPLVYPLRYDVLVRRDFLSFYAEHRDLYRESPKDFLLAARGLPYFQWVEHVLIARFQRHAVGDFQAVNEIFARRVEDTVALYESIVCRGFDHRYPIVPFTSQKVLPTSTGKITGARYYMGDGCHRLACLMALGFEAIPRDLARIKRFRRLQPRDNTSRLEPHLSIEWPLEWLEGEQGAVSPER